MDSMRALNTSLPRSSPRRRMAKPKSELIQAFKAAALSVTQLYKTAAAEEDNQRDARTAGYQEALEDLQFFLDEQNLGLDDGEGWQVRQWATQRSAAIGAAESDPELEGDEAKRTRSTSPTMQHKAKPEAHPPASTSATEPTRSGSLPPVATGSVVTTNQPATSTQRPEMFHFRSSIPTPQPQDMEMDTSDRNSAGSAHNSSSAFRLEVIPKSTRSSSTRHSNHNRDRQSGASAGAKRKAPFIDFFDIGGLNSKENHGGGGGGGKRGRFA